MESDCIVTQVRKNFYQSAEITERPSSCDIFTLKAREEMLSPFIETVIYYIICLINYTDDFDMKLEDIRELKSCFANRLSLSGEYVHIIGEFLGLCLEVVRQEEDGLREFIEDGMRVKKAHKKCGRQ